MTNISLETVASYQSEKRSWMLSQFGQGPGENPSIVLDVSAFTANTHYPNGFFPSGLALGKITGSDLYGPYAGRSNEVQTIGLGAASAGTITITFDGETTAAIAFNASAATVQAALLALSNMEPGDVVASGGPFPGVVSLTFGGNYAGENVPVITATPTGLTGGTVTIATGTGGGSGSSDGTEICAGLLHSSVKVPNPAVTTIDTPAALVVAGFIKLSKLPIALDSAGQADLKLCHFVA